MNNEFLTLSNGVEIPQLGFGVFQIPPEETKDVVKKAIEIGNVNNVDKYYDLELQEKNCTSLLKYGFHHTVTKKLKKHSKNHWTNYKLIILIYTCSTNAWETYTQPGKQ